MIDQYPSANGVLTSLIWRKTMSGGETSLSGYDNASQALSYTPGQEQVYLNGILLVRGDDYTATNGTSITGLAALSASDFIQVNCYNNFSVASVPTTSLTGTVSNAQLTNSSITINGNAVSLGGSVSLPGDIESVTASSPLTGGGTSGAVTVGIQSASTTQSGAVQLSDSTSTTSSVLAATPTAVKSAYDLANGAIPKALTTTTGDIIYASSANTPARLGIGSTDQVLKVSGGVPVWATPATASSDYVKISHYSVGTNTASPISFNNVFTSPTNTTGAYRYYKIIMNGYSDTGAVQFKLRNSGTDRTDSAYYSGVSLVSASGVHSTQNANASGAWILCDGNPNGWSVDWTLYNPKLGTAPYNKPQYTALTHSRSSDRGGYNTGFFDYFYDSDGFSIHHAGNFQGTITIYGIKV